MNSQPQPMPTDAQVEPPRDFDPPATRPGIGGFLVILAILALPFLASNLSAMVDNVF